MLAAGAIAAVYVLFAAASKPEPSAGLTRFARGEMHRLMVLADPPPLPTRALVDAEGRTRTLAEFEGEVLVVNLWATWCAACVEEMPTLGALQRRFEGRGVRVIPVSIDQEAEIPRAKMVLAQRTRNTLPFFVDMTRGIGFDVGGTGMPITIIYSRDGRELARLAGGADWGGADAAALVEAALAQ